jgi:hypothetical protein
MSIIQGSAKQGATRGFYPYEIDGSLRFNDDDSAYLSRTPASAGDLKTWTWSGWVKRGNLGGSVLRLFNVNDSGSPFKQTSLRFDSDQLRFFNDANSTADVKSSAVYRDASAWYHIILAVDTIQGTPANRIKLYVNGEQITALATSTYPNQNTDMYINAARAHQIGTSATSTQFFDGYLAEVHFLNGIAATADDFGELKSGVWVAKEYTGAHDSAAQISAGTTNGFYLKFAGNANDSSGNGNNWTASVGIDTDDDYMADSPTDNFATLNPVGSVGNGVYSNGNLAFTSNSASASWQSGLSTIGVSSGKWYFEATATAITGANLVFAGAAKETFTAYNSYLGSSADSWGVQYGNGDSPPSIFKYNSNSGTSITAGSIVAGNIIQVAVDVDNGHIWFGKNNTWAEGDPTAGTGASFTNLSGTIMLGVSSNTTGNKLTANFGQQPFTYTPPTGYLALSTANLPEPEISPADDESPSDYFATNLWPGNGGTFAISGNNFAPDLVWIKCRDTAHNHYLVDTIRGSSNMLATNLTTTEPAFSPNEFTSFNSDGYTVNFTAGGGRTNYAPDGPYVGWSWKAGGTGVSNTAGSRTSTVSVNQDAGFSIVSWTANAADPSTVGHGLVDSNGLGVAPNVIIMKARTGVTDQWRYGGSNLPSWSYSMALGGTTGQNASPDVFNQTAPTSTVFTVGGDASVNTNNATMIAYCFAEIEGYSKFGSYTGNNNADGPFVYTGFRPAFVIAKASGTTGNWVLFDSTRYAFNDNDLDMFYVNENFAESAFAACPVDLLSNGFKIRHTTVNGYANAAATHIYMAFAENPFKYANAR